MPLKLNGQIFYNTQEACKLAGANRDTFLRWVRQKKFTDVGHRDRNGWRLFTNEDIQRLKTRVNHVEKVDPVK
jgi:DNA-binding transcriptional MerR regulator